MKGGAAGQMEVLAAGVAVGSLGNADDGDVAQAEVGQHLAGDLELAGAAVDQDEIGPIGKLVVVGSSSSASRRYRAGSGLAGVVDGRRGSRSGGSVLLGGEALEAARQNLAHHGVVVARREVCRADVELAVLAFDEAVAARRRSWRRPRWCP